VLREAVRPFVGDAVAGREKRPFLAPPLAEAAQDLLRERAAPFLDQRRVVALLDRLPSMDARARSAHDAPLLLALSARLLGERLKLADP
jgi:asparagine synthase (glutamine-hydrolysing)